MSLDYTADALSENEAFFRRTGRSIMPLRADIETYETNGTHGTVGLCGEEKNFASKLAWADNVGGVGLQVLIVSDLLADAAGILIYS